MYKTTNIFQMANPLGFSGFPEDIDFAGGVYPVRFRSNLTKIKPVLLANNLFWVRSAVGTLGPELKTLIPGNQRLSVNVTTWL